MNETDNVKYIYHQFHSMSGPKDENLKPIELNTGEETEVTLQENLIQSKNYQQSIPLAWVAEKPYHEPEWIVCEVIHLACFFVALYILYALVHFYTVQQSRHIYSGRSSGSRWLEKMCIMSVVCAIVRFTTNQLLLFTGWRTRERCSILLNISIALYFLSLYPIYLFLWIRQRIFYSNRALKHLYNKMIRFISWATIFCFFAVSAVSMILLVVDRKNSASGRVCSDHRHGHYDLINIEENITEEVTPPLNKTNSTFEQGLQVNTVTGLLGGAIQTSFLVLFLYPIMDNKLRAVRNLNMTCHRSLMKLIRRAFVLSGVCIFSDVAIAIGVKGIYSLFPDAEFAPLAMYDVNLLINIVCIVATFRRWRRMLFPCAYDCYNTHMFRRFTGKRYFVEQTTTRMNSSKAEGPMSSGHDQPKEQINDNKETEKWETTAPKAPVVDVLLDCDCEVQHKNDDKTMEKTTPKSKQGFRKSFRIPRPQIENSPKSEAPNAARRNAQRRRYTAGATEMPNKPIKRTPMYATSRFSFRSKKSNNIVTTKLVLKSEQHFAMNDAPVE